MIDLAHGACREVAVATFLADDDAGREEAKRICAGCEVRLDCLALALSTIRLDGV